MPREAAAKKHTTFMFSMCVCVRVHFSFLCMSAIGSIRWVFKNSIAFSQNVRDIAAFRAWIFLMFCSLFYSFQPFFPSIAYKQFCRDIIQLISFSPSAFVFVCVLVSVCLQCAVVLFADYLYSYQCPISSFHPLEYFFHFLCSNGCWKSVWRFSALFSPRLLFH